MNARDITVRIARNDEGGIVRDLAAEIGVSYEDWEIDWSDIFPYWLVAECEGRIIGAINIRISKPFASVEMLSLASDLTKKVRGVATDMLVAAAKTVVAQYGSQAICGLIPDELASYRRVAERRGYVPMAHGHMMLGRLS